MIGLQAAGTGCLLQSYLLLERFTSWKKRILRPILEIAEEDFCKMNNKQKIVIAALVVLLLAATAFMLYSLGVFGKKGQRRLLCLRRWKKARE